MAKKVFKKQCTFPISLSEKIAPNQPILIVNSVVDTLDINV